GRQTRIGIPRQHAIRSGKMPESDTVISLHLMRIHPRLLQKLVQQPAASRAGLAIRKLDVLPRQILDLTYALGIPRSQDESFFPARKRDHAEFFPRKLLSE